MSFIVNSSVKFSEGFFFHDEELELAMVHIYQYAKKGKIFNKFCAWWSNVSVYVYVKKIVNKKIIVRLEFSLFEKVLWESTGPNTNHAPYEI